MHPVFLILYRLKYYQITLLIFSCLVFFSSFIFASSKNVPLLDSSPKCTTQIMQVVRSKLRSEQSSVHAVSEVQVISITAEIAVYQIAGQRVIGEPVSSSKLHAEPCLVLPAHFCWRKRWF